jgi:hypothetical protein
VATNRLTLFLQHLRRSTLLRDGAAQTDAQLLEAFLQGRDGLALEMLVRRHAPILVTRLRFSDLTVPLSEIA